MYLQPSGLILQWLLVILTPFYQLRRGRALTVMAVQMGCPSFLGFMTKMKAYIAMVSVQFGYAGMCIVSVLCLKKGMSHYVLVVYRHAAATAALAPFAFVLERKVRPKMTLSTFLKISALGWIEPVIDQNLYYLGMQYTSATFTSALFNVLPAITFIMALILRMEKVKIRKLPSQAKVVGTLVSLAGAMLMTLYKGPIIEMVWSKGRTHHASSSSSGNQNWIKGTIMLLASCTGWAGFFVLQSITLRSYPAELSLAAWVCFMGFVQGAAVALVMERHTAAWSVGFDTRLLAPIYSGLICSGITYYLQGMVMKERGPVFVTAFYPLCMIIVAILGSIILGDEISLGRVIGAIIIVLGLYCVVWGKSKDPIGSSTTDVEEKKGSKSLPITTTMNSDKPKSNENGVFDDVVIAEISARNVMQNHE